MSDCNRLYQIVNEAGTLQVLTLTRRETTGSHILILRAYSRMMLDCSVLSAAALYSVLDPEGQGVDPILARRVRVSALGALAALIRAILSRMRMVCGICSVLSSSRGLAPCGQERGRAI